MKDILRGCTYLQEILINFFFGGGMGNNAPFIHTNLAKIKYTCSCITETICQCNSILRTYAYSQEILIWFFLREHGFFGKNVLFYAWCVIPVSHVYMNLNYREAVWICFWQSMSKYYSNVTIINRLFVSDYYHIRLWFFLSDCPSLMHRHWHSLFAALSSNVGAWGMWAY